MIDESTVGAYHVTSITVRRAFLTGYDPRTGVDDSHRKEMLEQDSGTLAEPNGFASLIAILGS